MGGGDHGHHGPGPRMKVPDYSIYKVENCPELIRHQEALAVRGLKDPWIRNEAWRYDPKEWGTIRSRSMTIITRGMKYGFAAFVATIALEKAYSLAYPSADHGHGHH